MVGTAIVAHESCARSTSADIMSSGRVSRHLTEGAIARGARYGAHTTFNPLLRLNVWFVQNAAALRYQI